MTLTCDCCGIEITHRKLEVLPYCLQCGLAMRLLTDAVHFIGTGEPQVAADRAREAREILSDAASYKRGRHFGRGYTWPGQAHIAANRDKEPGGET